MGKKIAIGIMTMMCLFFVWGCQTATVDKTAEDYGKIETLTKAVDEVAFSKETYSMDRHKIFVYEIGSNFQGKDDFSTRLKSKLGDDFDGKLSNGDKFYVRIQISGKGNTLYANYKIYAGGYEDENMLYPTWNYTKLPFSDAVSFDGLAAGTIK